VCPTPIGRIHTRVATIVGPAILGAVVSAITGDIAWLVLIGLYLLQGVALDAAVYSWLLRYQPPWMTGVLALAELGLLLVLANLVELGLPITESIIFYWGAWLLAIITKIALLPIFSLTYLESSQEFRRIQWSIPPSQAAVPIAAAAAEAEAGPGAVLEQASGVHRRPLEPRPSPSGIHATPPGVSPS
jgi:hypothetical protein